MKTAIITDSAANLSPEFIKKHNNLFVIPLMIMIDNISHRDQVEVTAEEVYKQLDNKQITTSLPSIEDLTTLLDTLKEKAFTDVIVINISSELSGTFNAFRLVFEDYKDLNITQYNTKTLAGAQGHIVEYALELIKAKKAPSDIIPLLDELRYKDSMAIYTIETLKYLRKGGRIGKVEGTIGDILKVKPVITVNDDGVYVTLSKSFGIQRALIVMKKLLIDKFGTNLIDLTIHYGNDSTKAEALAEKLKTDLNIRNLSLSPLTPVLGIHTGPQMFAYIARRIK